MTSVLKEEAYQRLSKEIKKRGLKNKYVAQQIGITPNYLGQVLNGKRKMSANVAIRLSKFLDLPVDIFLD